MRVKSYDPLLLFVQISQVTNENLSMPVGCRQRFAVWMPFSVHNHTISSFSSYKSVMWTMRLYQCLQIAGRGLLSDCGNHFSLLENCVKSCNWLFLRTNQSCEHSKCIHYRWSCYVQLMCICCLVLMLVDAMLLWAQLFGTRNRLELLHVHLLDALVNIPSCATLGWLNPIPVIHLFPLSDWDMQIL